MAKELPFDENMMTLIMGIEPEAPGQHGRTMAPMPGADAVRVITEIRDMCEDFLKRADKGDEDEGPEPDKADGEEAEKPEEE